MVQTKFYRSFVDEEDANLLNVKQKSNALMFARPTLETIDRKPLPGVLPLVKGDPTNPLNVAMSAVAGYDVTGPTPAEPQTVMPSVSQVQPAIQEISQPQQLNGLNDPLVKGDPTNLLNAAMSAVAGYDVTGPTPVEPQRIAASVPPVQSQTEVSQVTPIVPQTPVIETQPTQTVDYQQAQPTQAYDTGILTPTTHHEEDPVRSAIDKQLITPQEQRVEAPLQTPQEFEEPKRTDNLVEANVGLENLRAKLIEKYNNASQENSRRFLDIIKEADRRYEEIKEWTRAELDKAIEAANREVAEHTSEMNESFDKISRQIEEARESHSNNFAPITEALDSQYREFSGMSNAR